MREYEEVKEGLVLYTANEEDFWDEESVSHTPDGQLSQFTPLEVLRCDVDLIKFKILAGDYIGRVHTVFWWGEGRARPEDYLTQNEYESLHSKEMTTAGIGEYKDALGWIVDQFEKVLAGEKAGSVFESLSYAKSLLKS